MKKRMILAGVLVSAVIVAVAILRSGSDQVRGSMTLSGNVEVTEVNVGFRVPGRVKILYTDEGLPVNRGETVAKVDSAEFESMANQARASVANAKAHWEKAKSDFDRFKKLFEDGVISPQQMTSAQTSLDSAASQLRMYRAGLRTAVVRLDETVISSPLDGVVLRKNVEQGETVRAGEPVFTIGDLSSPWIKVYVSEAKLGFVKLGQKAEVSVDSFPGKRYEGEVTYISSQAEFTPKNVQTQEERVKLVFGVKVKVKNDNNDLKPGMPADVMLYTNND